MEFATQMEQIFKTPELAEKCMMVLSEKSTDPSQWLKNYVTVTENKYNALATVCFLDNLEVFRFMIESNMIRLTEDS